jgi:hypothetical protein
MTEARPLYAAWLSDSWSGAMPLGYPSAGCAPTEPTSVSPKLV